MRTARGPCVASLRKSKRDGGDRHARKSTVRLLSARRSRDKLADLFLDGGAEPLQGKGGWPDVTVVEVCSVLETERRVSRLELLTALEEADNLAVLGIRGHPVPGIRRERRRAGFDDRMQPL